MWRMPSLVCDWWGRYRDSLHCTGTVTSYSRYSPCADNLYRGSRQWKGNEDRALVTNHTERDQDLCCMVCWHSIIGLHIWVFRARQHQKSWAPVMNDLWWLWYPGIDGGVNFPDICLTVQEKLRKNISRSGIEPEPARREKFYTQPQQWAVCWQLLTELNRHFYFLDWFLYDYKRVAFFSKIKIIE